MTLEEAYISMYTEAVDTNKLEAFKEFANIYTRFYVIEAGIVDPKGYFYNQKFFYVRSKTPEEALQKVKEYQDYKLTDPTYAKKNRPFDFKVADKERNIEDINDVDRQKYDLFERDKNESYIHPISVKRESPLYSHVLTQQQREYVVTTLTKEFPSEEESFRELYLDPNSKLGNISHLSPEQLIRNFHNLINLQRQVGAKDMRKILTSDNEI